MLSFKLYNLVVQIVYVVLDIITERGSGSSFQFENYGVAIVISASSVNLRTKQKFACFHVSKVIFLL